MQNGKGHIDETYIQAGFTARISCAPGLIPAPGQYLLAHAPTEPNDPLPHPVFKAASHSTGFYAAHPLPVAWTPGTQLQLRGPFGRGFHLPSSARKIVLAAFGKTCSRLLALLEPALSQKAEITLLTNHPHQGLPLSLEILPLSALPETSRWADYLAFDIPRSNLAGFIRQHSALLHNGYTTEILLETPLPCGGSADCAICAVQTKKSIRLACKDGPVFPAKEF